MSALLSEIGMRQMRRTSKYTGLTQFDYCAKGSDIELTCWLEAEEGYPQTYSEPGCDASATLCLREVNGIDILELLNEATVEEIETTFLEQEFDEGDY